VEERLRIEAEAAEVTGLKQEEEERLRIEAEGGTEPARFLHQ